MIFSLQTTLNFNVNIESVYSRSNLINMKKIFSVIIVLFASSQLWGQGMLRVTTNENIPIKLSVDNRVYKRHNRSLTIGNLPAGKHWVQVFAISANGEGRRRNLIYDGRLKIHKGEMTLCVVDPRTGDADVSHVPAPKVIPQNSNDGDDIYGNMPYSPMPADTAATPPSNNSATISSDEMNKLARKVSDKLTDTEKMKKMKAALTGKSVSTAQVGTMLGWLNFETTRLEFAEWAYSITTDKEHYSQLDSKFNFRSTKENFGAYISGNK